MVDQLTQIANDLETRMLRIDEAQAYLDVGHPKYAEYNHAVDELDEAIVNLRSAIRHIHNSMVDKVIWELDSQMLRG